MMLARAVALTIVLAVLLRSPAAAQTGAVPGLPFAAPQQCQQLRALRDEWMKQARALQAVDRKTAPPGKLCMLFKDMVVAESALVRGLERHGGTCSVPTDVIERTWLEHIKTIRVANGICTRTAQGPPLIGDFWTPDELGRMLRP